MIIGTTTAAIYTYVPKWYFNHRASFISSAAWHAHWNKCFSSYLLKPVLFLFCKCQSCFGSLQPWIFLVRLYDHGILDSFAIWHCIINTYSRLYHKAPYVSLCHVVALLHHLMMYSYMCSDPCEFMLLWTVAHVKQHVIRVSVMYHQQLSLYWIWHWLLLIVRWFCIACWYYLIVPSKILQEEIIIYWLSMGLPLTNALDDGSLLVAKIWNSPVQWPHSIYPNCPGGLASPLDGCESL